MYSVQPSKGLEISKYHLDPQSERSDFHLVIDLKSRMNVLPASR
jgi:hypothetical protein